MRTTVTKKAGAVWVRHASGLVLALGVIENALKIKKALRRVRKLRAFKPKVWPTHWRREHPGFSRMSARGWRGMNARAALYKPLCTKKHTLGRVKLAEAQKHNRSVGGWAKAMGLK